MKSEWLEAENRDRFTEKNEAMCVCVCVHACVHACVRACMCACV